MVKSQPTSRAIKDELTWACLGLLDLASGILVFKTVMNARERVKS